MVGRVLSAIVATLLCAGSAGVAQTVVTVDDSGGAMGRTGSPVSASVSLTDAAMATAAREGRLGLLDMSLAPERQKLIPAQFSPGAPGTGGGTLHWLMPPGPAGKRRFKLMAILKASAPLLTVSHDKSAGTYTVLDGKAPVLRYNFGTVPVPPGVKGKYAVARSNYVHPLYGPGGEELTKDFSPDHPHHRGIYWAWPEVYYKGSKRDLHALQGVFARPVGMAPVQRGAVFAQLEAVNQWKWGDAEPIVKETAIIRAYAAGPGGRCVDFEFRFLALVKGVSVARRGQKAYGGLNLRCSSRTGQKIAFHTDPVGTAVRRAWAQIVGVPPKGQTPVGITILQHASNPEYPGDWQPYPKIDWLQPTFPSKGTKYTLSTDKPLVLKFRLVVGAGEFDNTMLADLWSAYNAKKQAAAGKAATAAKVKVILTGPRKGGDAATVAADGAATVIGIRSTFGIGRAEIRRVGKDWPERVVLRLHTKALEGFSATDGTRKFTHSVRHSEVTKGKPIDVALPEALLDSTSETIRIQWVDFYR